MVAAEAAACGALPVVADHSGLAEVPGDPRRPRSRSARARGCASRSGRRAVRDLATALIALAAGAGGAARGDARGARGDVARERFSWEGVARGVVAAAAAAETAALPEP